MLAEREAQLSETLRKFETEKNAVAKKDLEVRKNLEEQKLIIAEAASKSSDLNRHEEDLKRRAAELERNLEEFALLKVDFDREKDLVTQKDEGLEQLRLELEKWRSDLMDHREKMEEVVRERVAEAAHQAESISRPLSTAGNEQAIHRKEVELHSLEESLLGRERDLETKERTLAVELERLEKERAEVQDLWSKIEESEKGIKAGIDEKMIAELDKRKSELDGLYLKMALREDQIRKDEQRLEGEWGRLQMMEEELSGLAKLLKSKEDEIRRLDGAPEIRQS